jgi:hypothetical protein
MRTSLAHKFVNAKTVKTMDKIMVSGTIKSMEVWLRLTLRFSTGEHKKSMNK